MKKREPHKPIFYLQNFFCLRKGRYFIEWYQDGTERLHQKVGSILLQIEENADSEFMSETILFLVHRFTNEMLSLLSLKHLLFLPNQVFQKYN